VIFSSFGIQKSLKEEYTLTTDATATPPTLNSFNLGTSGGRFDFLWRLSEMGEPGLLPATSHVWSLLAEPVALRATLMAATAKVAGKGKPGLLNVLKQFLADFEAETDPPPLPERMNFTTSEEWNEAVAWHFEFGEQAIVSVIERYSAILNGEKPNS
jgi:hypothetical protein